MKLESLWIVCDPTLDSIPADYCFEITVADLGDYIVGGGPRAWNERHSAVYTTEAEATADAERRLASLKTKAPTYEVRRADGKIVKVTVPQD
jgi:hypothetical protein